MKNKSPKALLLSYVDDILAATAEEIADATMKDIDSICNCSDEEVVREGSKGVSFCGIVIETIRNGSFIYQKSYTRELIQKNQLEECDATKIILDKESDEEDRGAELEQQEAW